MTDKGMPTDERWSFKLVQDGLEVVMGDASDPGSAVREVMHYAAMYGQDGPCTPYLRKGKSAWCALVFKEPL